MLCVYPGCASYLGLCGCSARQPPLILSALLSPRDWLPLRLRQQKISIGAPAIWLSLFPLTPSLVSFRPRSSPCKRKSGTVPSGRSTFEWRTAPMLFSGPLDTSDPGSLRSRRGLVGVPWRQLLRGSSLCVTPADGYQLHGWPTTDHT